MTRPLDRFVPYLVLEEPNLAIEFYSPLIAGPRPEVAADAAGDLSGKRKCLRARLAGVCLGGAETSHFERQHIG